MSYLADELVDPWLAESLLTAINAALVTAGYDHPDDWLDTDQGIGDGETSLAYAGRLPAMAVDVGECVQTDRRGGRIGVYQTHVTVYIATAAPTDAEARDLARRYCDIIRAAIDTVVTGFELLQCVRMAPTSRPYVAEYECPSHISELEWLVQLECDETTE